MSDSTSNVTETNNEETPMTTATEEAPVTTESNGKHKKDRSTKAKVDNRVRSDSKTKVYKIPVRQITENHNPRNPLGPGLKDFTLFTGEANDLWQMAVSDDPAERARFVAAIDEKDTDFAAWAVTFLTVGQLEPAEVRDNGGKGGKPSTYTLIFGCRRCLAVLYNWCKTGRPAEPTIDATLAPKQNATSLLHRSIVENLRKNPNPMEGARAIQMALNQGQTHKEIAEIYGMSEGWVYYTLKLLQLPPDKQRAVEEGKLKPSKALRDAGLVKGTESSKKGGKGVRTPKDEPKTASKQVREYLSPFREAIEKTDYTDLLGEEEPITLTLTAGQVRAFLEYWGEE